MIETRQTLRRWHNDESTTTYRTTPVLAETAVFVISAYVCPRMVQFLLVRPHLTSGHAKTTHILMLLLSAIYREEITSLNYPDPRTPSERQVRVNDASFDARRWLTPAVAGFLTIKRLEVST